MSGLVIEHGNPWWLSPDVWVVPTSDPSAPSPGVPNPVVGEQYYATANVHNPTTQDILNATVYFWWANPSLGVLTTVNANLIGTSSVSVSAEQTANTLSLTPWEPSFQNNGHECIIAAVVEDGGQPPLVLDGDNDATVAQHNLGVVQLGTETKGRFHYAFQVANPHRLRRSFTIAAHQAPIADVERLLTGSLRKAAAEAPAKEVTGLGFLPSPCPEPHEDRGAKAALKGVELEPFASTGFSLVGNLKGGAALIHVTQSIEDRVVGGLSVLLLPESR